MSKVLSILFPFMVEDAVALIKMGCKAIREETK